MKGGNLPQEGQRNDIFALPDDEAMDSDVSHAAKILRSFVSQIGTTPKNAVDDALSDDRELFPMAGSSLAPATDTTQREIHDLDQYIESVNKVSLHLEQDLEHDAPRITPRIISVPNGAAVQDLRLVYQGKATKRQLERLRKKVMQQAQSRSGLQAVPRAFAKE